MGLFTLKNTAKEAIEILPSQTDIARLNLARALIVNPELLIMHMPMNTFTDGEADELMALLKEHVQERGVGFPTSGNLRRPRTVFISASSNARLRHASSVFVLHADDDSDGPLRELTLEERESGRDVEADWLQGRRGRAQTSVTFKPHEDDDSVRPDEHRDVDSESPVGSEAEATASGSLSRHGQRVVASGYPDMDSEWFV